MTTSLAPPNALTRLVAALDRHARLAIAVSGGVDSMTLAHVARRFSRAATTMVHATGPAVPRSAGERVRSHARRHDWPLTVLDAGELADPRYRANPVDRCYYCKSNLYARMRALTSDTIASGTNRDDLDDYRPGLTAAEEHGVVHPYVEADIDKAAVYDLARRLGLEDLERLPAQPCLSSRVETGIAIDAVDLGFIDRVESSLAASLGRSAVVRCRVSHRGVVIELGDGIDPDAAALARRIGADACAVEGRVFAGIRRYARGAAFIRVAAGE